MTSALASFFALALSLAACHSAPGPAHLTANASPPPPASTSHPISQSARLASAAYPYPPPVARRAIPARDVAPVSTATPVRTATPPATEHPLPADLVPQSPLIVDSASGLVYASYKSGAKATLYAYSTITGRLIVAQPLEPGEVLLDVDASGRIYLMHSESEVRVVSAEARHLARLTMPTPDWSDPAFGEVPFPLRPAFPIVDRPRGRLFAFSGPHVTVLDPDTGAILREFEVPPAGTHGSIVRAAVDQAGTVLYLALADAGLGDWEDAPGVRLMALDLRDLDILDQAELIAGLTEWIPTGDGVIASGWSYKQRGSDQRVWKKGREIARRTESAARWSVYDSTRHRVIGRAEWALYGEPPPRPLVADAATLDLDSVSGAYDRPVQDGAGDLTAFDPATDHLFGRGPAPDRLAVARAASLDPVAATDAESPRVYATVSPSYAPNVLQHLGPPPLLNGLYYPRSPSRQPTPDRGRDFALASSRDAGETWVALETAGLPVLWPEGVVASDAFERDQTLFGWVAGFGVFRSTDGGRTWTAASDGLGALYVRQVVLSPTFSRDGTLIAVSEDSYRQDDFFGASAWRSRDAGETWELLGAFTTVAFSPEFATDHRLMAFARSEDADSRFHVSTDGGDTWRPRGRLPELPNELFLAGRLWVIPASRGQPEVLLALATSNTGMGGPAHWNESGARVFRSTDGGSAWDVAWGDYEQIALEGALFGPVPATLPTPWSGAQPSNPRPDAPMMWVLTLEGGLPVTLVSEDGGFKWRQIHVDRQPYGRVVAMLPSGELLAWDRASGIRPMRVGDFDRGPPPTPLR